MPVVIIPEGVFLQQRPTGLQVILPPTKLLSSNSEHFSWSSPLPLKKTKTKVPPKKSSLFLFRSPSKAAKPPHSVTSNLSQKEYCQKPPYAVGSLPKSTKQKLCPPPLIFLPPSSSRPISPTASFAPTTISLEKSHLQHHYPLAPFRQPIPFYLIFGSLPNMPS